MNVFLDERCLVAPGCDIVELLGSWREIVDFARSNARSATIFIDQTATRQPQFLQIFNRLPVEHRLLFGPIAFGTERVVDWRKHAIAMESICRLATEQELLQDCAVCEVYEHRQKSEAGVLLGHLISSYAHLNVVVAEKIEPPGPPTNICCGKNVADFRKIGIQWNCVTVDYDLNSTRPPRDSETILTRLPERFGRLKRIERNGRRHVYQEIKTGRLLYVDNLHEGGGAHLEVFDANECHLGIADLDGNLKPNTGKPGRVISW